MNTKNIDFCPKMPKSPVLPPSLRFLATVFAILVLFMPLKRALASDLPNIFETLDKQAYEEYKKKHLEAAEDLFEDPAWHGVTLYQLGRYPEAINEFKRVKTPLGYYNLGNSYAQLGQFKAAKKAYQQALKTLKKSPNSKLAKKVRHNLALMNKLLAPKPSAHKPSNPNKKVPSPDQKTPEPKSQSQANSTPQSPSNTQPKPSAPKNSNPSKNPPPSSQKSNASESGKSLTQTKQKPTQTSQGASAQDVDRLQSNEKSSAPQENLKLQKGHTTPTTTQTAPTKNSNTKPLDEKQQSQQTWLNQIPDEPGLFLQRKFEYQFQQQTPQSPLTPPKKIW